MFEKRKELVWSISQAELRENCGRKWGWTKALVGVVVSASLFLAAPPTLTLTLTLTIATWMDTLSSLPPCTLFLFLNILILFLALINATSPPCTQYKADVMYDHYYSTQFSFEERAVNEEKGGEGEEGEEGGRESEKALQRSRSVRELHGKKVKKASNLSRESSSPAEVIFEICSMEEEWCEEEEEEEKVKEKEGIMNLSCEELNARAETFIGNFYRELKMQREESWKRLCAIYRKSC